ncbi:hypothetical protein MDOR_10200 [Mycolicibacterium doricum]|uniref:Uncharacterized protein n=1 Tax=Mycolicibacterium doricum TaxID=126673 RepID=A0A1X1T3Y6_9MYCO|nr:hypothetical protein [Mycolicibacterium doricum]MCV7266698.1 hypothetical protein [Mycolicibacterium doricum]ORV39301.1 hypothetical protein AWC01_13195 [Mycolicibacterium doricum]BBZ06851.1 hypothetical protein MDOR_10200 [Mycolicibacterium doricum]
MASDEGLDAGILSVSDLEPAVDGQTRKVVERFHVSENLPSIQRGGTITQPEGGQLTNAEQLAYDQKSVSALLEVNKIVRSHIIDELKSIPPERLAPERHTDVSFVLVNQTPDEMDVLADLAAYIQADSDYPVIPAYVPLGGSGIPDLALDIFMYVATKAGDEGINIGIGIAIEAIRRYFADKRKRPSAISITIKDPENNSRKTIRINKDGELMEED